MQDDKMKQVKAAEERITQLSEDLRTCQTASRTLSQALDVAESELAEHRAGPQEHLVAIANLHACRQTIDELRQCPGVVETTQVCHLPVLSRSSHWWRVLDGSIRCYDIIIIISSKCFH